jgi:parallel beta-helix repeat protein
MKKYSLGIIFLLFFIAFSSIPAEASIIDVPGDYKSIGEAVAKAEPGSIIIVRPGSYSENIIINKPLFLRTSRGAEKTLITAKDPDKPAIHIIKTKDVTILGFTVKDSLIAGILVEKSKRIKINRNLVIKNENGLIFMSVQNGIIFGNHLDSNNSYGLYINKSSECLVSNNSVSYNGDKGFFIFASHNNFIQNNKINLNRWNGMLIWSSNNNIIKGNKTMRNTFGLVTGESTGNKLSNNTSLPDLFLILPVLLIYIGFIFYLVQMYFFKTISGR